MSEISTAAPVPHYSVWTMYGKSIAAGGVLVVTAVQAALSDSVTAGRISQVEALQISVAFVNALLVFFVPAAKGWPWAKTVLSAVLAGLQVAITLIVDGISSADVSVIFLAALMVFAGVTAPSRSPVAGGDAERDRPAQDLGQEPGQIPTER